MPMVILEKTTKTFLAFSVAKSRLWIPNCNIWFFLAFLAGDENPFSERVLALCSALKWRVATVLPNEGCAPESNRERIALDFL